MVTIVIFVRYILQILLHCVNKYQNPGIKKIDFETFFLLSSSNIICTKLDIKMVRGIGVLSLPTISWLSYKSLGQI